MKKALAILLSVLLIMAISLQAAALSTIAVKSVKLDKSSITLNAGKTYTLKATLTPANTTQKALTFVSSNKKVAIVDASGTVAAMAKGTAAITVYTVDKKIFAKCNVTVTQPAAAAPKSKKLVVYGAMNEPDLQLMQKQFKEDTGIELSYLRFDAGTASSRVLAEKNFPLADIIVGGSIEFYQPLVDNGLLVKYTSPSAKDIDPMFADPKGYYQGWYMGVLSIIINTDRFNKELAPKGVKEPKTWDDLLDPNYKDLLILANPATAGSGYIFDACQLFRLGTKDGWNYLTNVNKNVHHYTASAGDVINLVATGQFVIGMSWAHDSLTSQKQGYPIKILIPEKTAYEIGGLGIIKGGPNPDNAKTFVDWLLTQKIGDMMSKESNRYSVRKDVDSPAGMPKIEDVKLVIYDRAKATKMKPDVVKKITDMIAAGK